MTAGAITRMTAEGVVLSVFVQPRAAKNEVAGLHGEAVKLRLTAPPVEGAANKACIAFLAKALGLPKSALEIVAGQTGRHKQILVRPRAGQDRDAVEKIIHRQLLDA